MELPVGRAVVSPVWVLIKHKLMHSRVFIWVDYNFCFSLIFFTFEQIFSSSRWKHLSKNVIWKLFTALNFSIPDHSPKKLCFVTTWNHVFVKYFFLSSNKVFSYANKLPRYYFVNNKVNIEIHLAETHSDKRVRWCLYVHTIIITIYY